MTPLVRRAPWRGPIWPARHLHKRWPRRRCPWPAGVSCLALNPIESSVGMTNSKRAGMTMGALWLLLLVLAALRPLSLPDEGRYAEISRWMLVSGDWLTPRLDGIPFFHKPPLLHWLGSLSLATFGVNAWAARLVPALHAGLMLGLVYVTALRVSTPAVARRAGRDVGHQPRFPRRGPVCEPRHARGRLDWRVHLEFCTGIPARGPPPCRLGSAGFCRLCFGSAFQGADWPGVAGAGAAGLGCCGRASSPRCFACRGSAAWRCLA